MSNTISFTIPVTISALTRTAEMLHGMIEDGLSEQGLDTKVTMEGGATKIAVQKLPEVSNDAESYTQQANGDYLQDAPATDTTYKKEMERYNQGADTTAEAAFTPTVDISGMVETTPEVSKQPEVSSGIELDGEGLPWDARIHSGSKGRLAKGNGWKKKRNTDAALIVTVEAELRQALAVGAGTEANYGATGPVVETVAAGPVVDLVVTPSTPPINTFPELIQAITGAGIQEVAVTAACKVVGVSGIMMLPLAPLQIPAVAAELGL